MMSAGRPRSRSNRVKASNGDVVSNPPKSQITASIIKSPCTTSFAEAASTMCAAMPARARREAWRRLRRGLMLAAMKMPFAIIAAVLAFASPAAAIVGGAAPAPDSIGRSVVTIVGSRGNFCTGSLIAPALVLTVAHCVQPGADYKIVHYGVDRKPELEDVKSVAIHPGFKMAEMLAHRATADVALL